MILHLPVMSWLFTFLVASYMESSTRYQIFILFNKVCGDDACCYTPWMQADFREGIMTHLGGGAIHECFKFKVSEGFDPSSPTLGKYFQSYDLTYKPICSNIS